MALVAPHHISFLLCAGCACWWITQIACNLFSLGSWFSNFPSLIPTTCCKGYHNRKSIESANCGLDSIRFQLGPVCDITLGKEVSTVVEILLFSIFLSCLECNHILIHARRCRSLGQLRRSSLSESDPLHFCSKYRFLSNFAHESVLF